MLREALVFSGLPYKAGSGGGGGGGRALNQFETELNFKGKGLIIAIRNALTAVPQNCNFPATSCLNCDVRCHDHDNCVQGQGAQKVSVALKIFLRAYAHIWCPPPPLFQILDPPLHAINLRVVVQHYSHT